MTTLKRTAVMKMLKGSSGGKCPFVRRLSVLLVCFSFGCVSWMQAESNTDLVSTEVAQQKVKVKGVIYDDIGDPLAGATVQLQGTTTGVIADPDGRFEMEVPTPCKLVVSYIGMVSQTIDYNGEKEIVVNMVSTATQLDEVAVVAFAKQKKESVISSITTVKPSDLKVPSSNLTTAFAGRVAGLVSFQTSGEPGLDNADFFVRGITSFGANSRKSPLILIDGVELTQEDLARLNTDDIASFSVMKDAAATALYGARGGNGVILVTTKEGREGKISVNARVEGSFSSATKKVELSDAVTFMRMQNEAVKTRDPAGQTIYSSEKIYMTERGLYPDIFPATDWYKTMFKDVTSNYRANLSLSGGGTVARYYVAVNFTQDNGNLKVEKRNNFNTNIDLKKIDARSNINLKLTKTTDLAIRMNASFDDYRGPIDGGSDMYRKVVQSNPVMFKPYYEPDEKYSYAKHILFGNYGNAWYINPYAEIMKGYRDYSKNTMLVQFEGEQDLTMFTEGLKARVMFNMQRKSEYAVNRNYWPFYYDVQSYNLSENSYVLRRLNPGEGTEYLSYYPHGRQITSGIHLEATLSWARMFNEKHNVSGLLVYQLLSSRDAIRENLELSLPKRNITFSGRLTYDYESKYFAEFNFGYNGSERFHKDNRFGFFPSAVAGWMISNEPFFDPLKNVIKDLKIRGSYGISGNDAIGNDAERFYYLSNVSLGVFGTALWSNWGTNMTNNPGLVFVNRYANASIGWEKHYKTNLAIELALNNGFSTIAEYFHTRIENILIPRVIPNTMGIVQTVQANLGIGESSGVDIEVQYEKSFNSDFWITAQGTFTYTHSNVIEWEEPDYTNTPWLSKVGHSVGQAWGYIAERLFVDDEEVRNSPTQFGTYRAGDIKYRDVNGDGRITSLDQVPIGHPTNAPEIIYGLGPSIGYKGFDLSFFFQGNARRSFFFNLGQVTPFLGENAVIKAFADDYWSETDQNPYALWPRLANYAIENNAQNSTWFLQDASFIRLKSAEFGYRLPDHLLKKLQLTNLRVYVSGTNLAYWSRFKIWDPEMGGNGLGYPLQRVINVGINIGL